MFSETEIDSAAGYTSLRVYVSDKGAAVGEGKQWLAGKLFSFSTTIIEWKCSMRQKMFDINDTSNMTGSPENFLKTACNGKWKKVTNALLTGRTAKNRLDICVNGLTLN